MNKIFLAGLVGCLLIQSANAQDSTAIDRNLYPKKGNVGVTANVNGLINAISLNTNRDLNNSSLLLLRYMHSERLTYRIGFAPEVYNYNLTSTDSVGKDLIEYDSTISQSSFSIRPGVEYHFTGTKRLDPYVALDGEFGFVGKMNINSVRTSSDTTGTSRTMRTITEDGGYAWGAKLSFGMNYFVAPKLFFGVEYGLGVRGIARGGDRQDVIQVEPVSGSNTIVRELSSSRTSQMNFFVDPGVKITFGYFFGR